MDRAVPAGVAMDQGKNAIPAAKVCAKAISTGVEYTAIPKSAGACMLRSLPVGEYAKPVAAEGFEALQIQNFSRVVLEARALNAMQQVGAVGANVTVVAMPDRNLANAEAGGVIAGNQTGELRVNGRYWASLEALIPRAVSARSGSQDQIRIAGVSQDDKHFRFECVDPTGLLARRSVSGPMRSILLTGHSLPIRT